MGKISLNKFHVTHYIYSSIKKLIKYQSFWVYNTIPCNKSNWLILSYLSSSCGVFCVDNLPAAMVLVQHKPVQHFIGCSCTWGGATFSLSLESAAAQWEWNNCSFYFQTIGGQRFLPERRPQPSSVIKMIIIMIITEMRRFERYRSRVNPLDFISPPTVLDSHYYTPPLTSTYLTWPLHAH